MITTNHKEALLRTRAQFLNRLRELADTIEVEFTARVDGEVRHYMMSGWGDDEVAVWWFDDFDGNVDGEMTLPLVIK